MKDNGLRRLEFDPQRLRNFIRRNTNIRSEEFEDKVIRAIQNHEEYNAESITELLINTALENVDENEPHWTFDAAKILLTDLYSKASKNRAYDKNEKYGDFYGLLKTLGSKGIYSPNLLKKYTASEIKDLSKLIDPEKDLLFDYAGLHLLSTRYLTKDYEGNIYELPQERFLIIAMTLMQDEDKKKRHELISEAYWALSNLYMTVATPTLANAGLANGQLSSCFIDTVEDSLRGIYNSNTDIADVSKNGGGIGVYMGKVRSRGSDIRGYKGVSSGVVPWIKQLNNTAVSVDQLGTRKGSISVTLDVWHKDIEAFLDLRLNNGDERQRAHDIFPAVSLPDYFMEKVKERGDWYLFDPHEIKQVMGYSLEDYYDEEEGAGSFREKYEECVSSNKLTKKKVEAIDIMKRIMRSQLESGTPFMFFRDTVNRMNPNKHAGMIYCSNLCHEITQNQTPTQIIAESIENDDEIVIRKKAGDFVVCNLSSINLGKAVPDNVLERLIPIQVRMLDNVIDQNNLPVKQAEITNKKYRSVGLGTFGWHHLLALKNIQWESDEAVQYADKLYEKIAYLTIKSSNELAKEKGAYPLFEGSDWHTGKYFELRGYNSEQWNDLKEDVMKFGIRNAYLMAVAPNGSTATIAGTTATIDPIFKAFYYEEKKDYKLPVVAPDLNFKTYDVYRKSAHQLDQFYSIRQNAARQRHIDQSQSFNLYIPNHIRASVLLQLFIEAWEQKMKTIYYVRSTATPVEDCEWCQG